MRVMNKINKNELLNAGLQKFAAQDFKGAITELEKAIDLDKNFDLAYNALAESYNKLGEIDKAIETMASHGVRVLTDSS